MYTRTSSTLALVTLIAAAPAGAQTSGRPDGMRFVPDVTHQVRQLMERPDALGFHIDQMPDPSSCKHYQGIMRVDAGSPYFLVTRSGNLPGQDPTGGLGCNDSDGETDNGHVMIVRMDSRPRHGERLRSNRLHPDLAIDDTVPPTADRGIRYFTVVGGDPTDPDPAAQPGLWPGDPIGATAARVYQHPGGMALVGHMLAIVLEHPRQPGTFPRTQVMFFDVSNPEEPRFTSQYAPINGAELVLANAGVVAITPLPNGLYLMMIAGGDNATWFFYRSTLDDLSSGALSWDFIGSTPGPPVDNDDPTSIEHAHNSLTFLREGSIDGPLFVAGARGSLLNPGHERIDLYRVACQTPSECRAGESIGFEQVFKGRFIVPLPVGGGLEPLASLASGSSFHVTPSGELIFYAIEHDNDGPDDTVKAGEWRNIEVVRDGSPTLRPTLVVNSPREVDEGGSVFLTGFAGPPITRPFIQLFGGFDFTQGSLIADIDDLALERFDSLPAFARSWNWLAPEGCTAFAADRDSAGQRSLVGTGFVGRDPNLGQIMNDAGTENMDLKVDAIGFAALGMCQEPYDQLFALRWDLDRDGTFESFGSPVSFSAAALDGPSTVQVPAVSQGVTTGATTQTTASVIVRNVAPLLDPIRITNSAGELVNADVPFVLTKLPVTLRAAFRDPGVLDRQTASLAWGDGTVETETAFRSFDDARGDGAGSAEQRHTFTTPGAYQVALAIADDDGGTASRSATVRVVTPEQAVLEIVGLLDAAIASTTNVVARISLEKARKALAGGPGQSGALSKIRAGHRAAAIAFLLQAISWASLAEVAGADAGTAVSLMRDVVAALLIP